MLALLIAAGPWAVYRAAVNGGSDFPHFQEAGRFVAEQGTRHPRSALYRYLPSIDVACIPLYYYATRHLIKSYVRGWTSNIQDRNLSQYMYLLEHQGQ